MFTGLQSGRLSVTQDGELQIKDVTQDDEGYYICSADSGSGSNKAEAFLRVIGQSNIYFINSAVNGVLS